jgi:hypothetical protein
MPSTTSGWRAALVLNARLPVACGSRDGLSLSDQFHFGANYRIQRPTFHLATFPQLRGSQLAFRRRVSMLTLSIVSWVPSYTLASLTHFDENMGWLTRPFPEGFPPS